MPQSGASTFQLAATHTPALADFLAAHPGDYRILNRSSPNQAMMLGAYDVWGKNDPMMPLRYAELIAYTQGADQNQPLCRPQPPPPLLQPAAFLRYVVREREVEPGAARLEKLPHLLLVQDYRVVKGRDAVFAAMNDPGFDPAKTVVLEEAPDVEPDRHASPGTVRLVEASTDDLLIHARLTAPAILLVTDGWSKGWRAAAADGAAGQHYRVVPADYVLRAIALPAGDHRIRLEYRPTSFVVGKWTSLVAWLLLGIVAGTRIIRLSARLGWHVPEPRAKGVGSPAGARTSLTAPGACHPNVYGPGNGRQFESSSPPLLRYHFPRDHGHVRLCGHIRLGDGDACQLRSRFLGC